MKKKILYIFREYDAEIAQMHRGISLINLAKFQSNFALLSARRCINTRTLSAQQLYSKFIYISLSHHDEYN